MTKKLKGNILLLITTLAWGSSFVSQKLGMSDGNLSPSAFIAMRTLLGGIVLLPFCILSRTKTNAEKKTDDFKTLLIGGIVIGGVLCFASIMQTWGMAYPDTSAGKAGFITSLYIIFVPITGLFTGKKLSPLTACGIVFAAVGIYFLCARDMSAGFLSRGDFYVLISAVLYTAHILTTDYYAARVSNPVMLACVQFFVCGVIALIWSLAVQSFSFSAVKAGILPILYSGIVSCGIGYTLQTVGQKYTDPTSASLIMSLESVFSAVTGALFIGEHMYMEQIFGCILTFTAVVLTQIPFKPKKTPIFFKARR